MSRRLKIAIATAIAMTAATTAWACTTHSIWSGGRYTTCTTCCYGNNCTTNCY